MSDEMQWKFIEFNPRRAARGAEAARMEVNGEWIWCSLKDLKNNVREFGEHPELQKAIAAYKGHP
jgi:hypothetical protein